jgi:hypothetical protein
MKAQEEAIVEKGFVIISSTKDYNSALKLTKEVNRKLNIAIDLRGYYPDEKMGLDTDIACGCGENHGYIARGRFDDGEYLSIEYSDNFEAFTDGYYIVVAASGTNKESELTHTLKKVQSITSDAYIKNSTVYIGCMH